MTRSANANVVVYEARLSSAATLDPEEPVRPTWFMLAEDGRREDLELLESALAYGVDACRGAAEGAFVVSLRAHPAFPVWVAVEASGGLFPRVEQVEAVGVDPSSGAEVRERHVPPG